MFGRRKRKLHHVSMTTRSVFNADGNKVPGRFEMVFAMSDGTTRVAPCRTFDSRLSYAHRDDGKPVPRGRLTYRGCRPQLDAAGKPVPGRKLLIYTDETGTEFPSPIRTFSPALAYFNKHER